MIEAKKLNSIKGYINIANRAGYVIWGADNLKGYTHKLYLVLYRSDLSKTIEKTLKSINANIDKICLNVEDFNYVVQSDKCKLLAIKNQGLSFEIIKLLRGENG